MIKIDEIQLYNPGVLRTKILEEDFLEIKNDLLNQIEHASDKPNLGGHIEKSFKIKLSNTFKRILTEFISEYCDKFNLIHKPNHLLIEDDSWINLQKKHEFNPLHAHSGVLSWIL